MFEGYFFSMATDYRFPEHTLAPLARKRVMRGAPQHGATGLNILTLGLGDAASRLFTRCTQMADTLGPSLHRRVWQCGDVRLEDLSAVVGASASRLGEELYVVARGERARWGGDMTPSGWFSRSVLGRECGRAQTCFETRPHAVIAHADEPQLLNLVAPHVRRGEAGIYVLRDADDLRAARRDIKDMLLERHVAAVVRAERERWEQKHAAKEWSRLESDLACERRIDEACEAARRAARSAPAAVVVMPPHPAAVVVQQDCAAALAVLRRRLDECEASKSRAFESGVKYAGDVSG